MREEESYRLQAELNAARQQMEENQRQLQEALSAPRHSHITVIEHETASEEDDRTSEQSKFNPISVKNISDSKRVNSYLCPRRTSEQSKFNSFSLPMALTDCEPGGDRTSEQNKFEPSPCQSGLKPMWTVLF